MRKTVARVPVVGWALLLLALAATVAFGQTVASPDASAARSAAAATARFRDDVHVVAVAPTRAGEWAVGQQRGPQGDDHLVAVLLAAAVLVVAQARRRASLAALRGRAALCVSGSSSRAPPAFV